MRGPANSVYSFRQSGNNTRSPQPSPSSLYWKSGSRLRLPKPKKALQICFSSTSRRSCLERGRGQTGGSLVAWHEWSTSLLEIHVILNLSFHFRSCGFAHPPSLTRPFKFIIYETMNTFTLHQSHLQFLSAIRVSCWRVATWKSIHASVIVLWCCEGQLLNLQVAFNSFNQVKK